MGGCANINGKCNDKICHCHLYNPFTRKLLPDSKPEPECICCDEGFTTTTKRDCLKCNQPDQPTDKTTVDLLLTCFKIAIEQPLLLHTDLPPKEQLEIRDSIIMEILKYEEFIKLDSWLQFNDQLVTALSENIPVAQPTVEPTFYEVSIYNEPNEIVDEDWIKENPDANIIDKFYSETDFLKLKQKRDEYKSKGELLCHNLGTTMLENLSLQSQLSEAVELLNKKNVRVCFNEDDGKFMCTICGTLYKAEDYDGVGNCENDKCNLHLLIESIYGKNTYIDGDGRARYKCCHAHLHNNAHSPNCKNVTSLKQKGNEDVPKP